MISLVALKQQFASIKAEIVAAVEQVIESGQYISGPKVTELEGKIAKKLGVRHVITVANGTDALVISLKAFGIGPGDEVITTPFTFFASAEAVSNVGATPVFVDIDRHTYNIDVRQIEEKITPATKAIIPVHLFGQSAEMDEIQAIAQKHNLIVIEDACQAFGASYKGRMVGSLGDAACFSFFPTKNFSTLGDGGMIATSNDEIAAFCRKLRHHGGSKKYYHDVIGYNSRLDELHAAILLVVLEKIDEWNEQRRQVANYYRDQLTHLSFLRIAPETNDRTHIYHLFCLEAANRAALMQRFDDCHIQTGVYYPCPLHLQNVYQHMGYAPGDFPVAEEMANSLLAIPMSPFLLKNEQDQVIEALLGFGGE